MMRAVLFSSVALLCVSPALAQTNAQPAFIPFTVTEADATALQSYLNDNVPPRYGNPILAWVQNLEARQQKAAAPNAAPKIPLPLKPSPKSK